MRKIILLVMLLQAFLLGAQYSVPYSTDFYPDTDWYSVDSNNDGKTWSVNLQGESTYDSYTAADGRSAGVKYTYSYSSAADDWYISPAIHLEAGETYKVKFWGRSYSNTETYALYMSREQSIDAFLGEDALVSVDKSAENKNWQHFITLIVPEESGDYYFGFHCTSEKNKWYVWLTGFEVTDNSFAPGKPTGLTVTAGENKALSATLSWTLPTADADGVAFAEDAEISSVIVTRDGEVIATLDGDATEFEDTAATGLTAGKHTYGVSVVMEGKQSIEAVAVSKYIGDYAPESIPFLLNLSEMDQEEAESRFVVKVGDDSTSYENWKYKSTVAYGNYYQLYVGSSKTADDWLIAPSFTVSEPGVYRVYLSMKLGNYKANMQLCIGEGEDLTTYREIETYTSIPVDFGDIYTLVEIEEVGTYNLALHAQGTGPSYGTYYVQKIGMEEWRVAPLHVTDLKAVAGDNDGEVLVTWVNPTGTNVDTEIESLSKLEIYRNDLLVETRESDIMPGATCSFLDTPAESGVMVYKVIPYIGKYAAEGDAPTASSPWMGDKTQTLPYIVDSFTELEESLFEVLNLNDDEYEWQYVSSSNSYQFPAAGSNYFSNSDALLTPPIDMPAGYYTVSLSVSGGNSDATSQPSLKVALVPYDSETPVAEMMDQQSIKLPGMKYSREEAVMLHASEAGKYRVMFLYDTYSGSGDLAVVISSMRVEKQLIIPDVATALTVVAAEDLSLRAEVSWINPTTSNVEGISPEISEIVVLRNGEEVERITEGLALGASMNITDQYVPNSGIYTYTVEVYSVDGVAEESASVESPWIGTGKSIPYSAGEGSDVEFNGGDWTVFNVNADSKTIDEDTWEITWELKSEYIEITCNNYDADDWAMSPRLTFEEGKNYDISFTTWLGLGNSDATEWSVGYGNIPDPEAMTIDLGSFNTPATASSKSDAVTYLVKVTAVSATPEEASEDDAEPSQDIDARIPVTAGIGVVGFHADSTGAFRITKFSVCESVADAVTMTEAEPTTRYKDGNLYFSGNADVTVYDRLGCSVMRVENARTVSLCSLAKGVYIIRANVEGVATSLKVIK